MASVFVQIMSLSLCVKCSPPSKSHHNKCSSRSLQACRGMMKLSCQKGLVGNFTQCMWEFHGFSKMVLWISFHGRWVWVKGALILTVILSSSAVYVLICQRPPRSASFCPHTSSPTCVTIFCSTVCYRWAYLHYLHLIWLDLCCPSCINSPLLDTGLFCQTLLDFTAQSWLAVTELPVFQNTTFSFTCACRQLVGGWNALSKAKLFFKLLFDKTCSSVKVEMCFIQMDIVLFRLREITFN